MTHVGFLMKLQTKVIAGLTLSVAGIVIFLIILIVGTSYFEWVMFDFTEPWVRVVAISLFWVIIGRVAWSIFGSSNKSKSGEHVPPGSEVKASL